MKLTTKDSQLAVVDEVLSPEMFNHFWSYFNGLDFAYRSMNSWQKVWRINDGQILCGTGQYGSKAPFNSPMDWIHQTVLALAEQHFEDLVGKKGEDWQDILLTPYIYPAGTKISWHDDYGYTGACIFYPHKVWNPHWGGELFVAKTPKPQDIQGINIQSEFMTREYVAPLLNAYGMGNYVAPLPNRMAFTSGKTWHSINIVDEAAGDNVRCSVVVFFLKDKIS